jgi:hypothetical protein
MPMLSSPVHPGEAIGAAAFDGERKYVLVSYKFPSGLFFHTAKITPSCDLRD